MSDGSVVPREPSEPRFPVGAALRADPSLEWVADALVSGGSPWRLVRLTPSGATALQGWTEGARVAADTAALARRLIDAGLVHPVVAARPPLAGDVDVVVPVRDDALGLEATLRAVAPSAPRVTVVDDGSIDAAAVVRVAASHGADLLRRDVPGGPGAARNDGLDATVAPLVAFVDADVRPPTGWLDALVAHFDDPVVAAVAPRVRGPDAQGPRARFERAASPLDLGPLPGVVRPGAAVPYVPSAAIVVRRAAVGAAFDASLRTGEDVDLVWRLVAAGWLVRYEPGVEVVHAARSTWGGWVAQRFAYGSSAARLEARHGDAAAPLRADPRVLATLALAVAGRPRAAAGVLGWSAGSLARQLEGVVAPDGAEAVARRLAARGTALAAPGIARAAFRTYGPVLLAVAAVVPQVRRPVATLALAATAARWWRAGRPRTLSFPALSVADDLAYGAGVLVGAVRAGRLGALRPRLRPPARALSSISRT